VPAEDKFTRKSFYRFGGCLPEREAEVWLRSLRLAELEKAGLIRKNPVVEGNKVRVRYRITDVGKSMLNGIEKILK